MDPDTLTAVVVKGYRGGEGLARVLPVARRHRRASPRLNFDYVKTLRRFADTRDRESLGSAFSLTAGWR